MMNEWTESVSGNPLPWLLERDAQDPGVRCFALQDLLDLPVDDPSVVEAQQAVMSTGPVPAILDAQDAEGYWVKPGWGYSPKYRGTVWSIIMLAQLGADGEDARVRKACEYLLEHATSTYGSFSFMPNRSPAGALYCLGGNLCAALLDFGYLGDERLTKALEWEARAITGEGIALATEHDSPLHYYRSGTCGPCFCCSANNKKPCAWGAVKVMLALSKLPTEAHTPLIRRAIETGIQFLLSRDPAVADYPTAEDTKPSRSWFRFGYPVFYVTDVLQNLEVLVRLGCGGDSRLRNALKLLLDKQDELGRWKMAYSYNGKTWVDIEQKGKPSKWVTLRALRVLKGAGQLVREL
ncbi:MAG TPA: nitrogen fixation protein NifH [Anaerolineae bacterium]|nr:nitrogen fixation protein NifH [Anaerolineae bacterium]